MKQKRLCISFMICFFSGPMMTCSLFSKKNSVNVDANIAWSDDYQKVLIVQYSYQPKSENQDFFNAHDANDWSIRCLEANPDLSDPLEIARWPNESHDGGGIMQNPVYWLRKAKRIIYVESQIPSMYGIDNQVVYELLPPNEVTEKLVGKVLAPGVAASSPIPAPDGKTVAVWFQSSYIKGGPFGPTIHSHFVSFFKTSDGSYIGSLGLPFKDDQLDPWLVPASGHKTFRYKFLWSQNSREIFIVNRDHSWSLSVDTNPKIRTVEAIPLKAIPTSGGLVAPDGSYLYVVQNRSGKTQTEIKSQKISDWIPFEKVPLVQVGQGHYHKP